MNKAAAEIIEITKKYNLNILENSLIFNESGMDFLVVFAKDIYGKEWVLRFPRRDDVIQTTEVEKDILDLVNQNVNFEAPKWEIFQNDMIAYQKLKGFPMGTINHEIQDYEYEMDINNIPLCFYESFAKLLVDLHAISPDKVVSTQLTVFSTNEIREDMRCRMEKIKETLGVSEALWNRWQIWLNQDELWPKEVGFIHGDVHPGHILINSKSEVTGLIDWTEGKVSDISIDFVVFYKLFNESGLDKLISAYKNAGGYVWPKMKEHIIELTAASPVAIAEFALKSQLDSVMEYAKYELGIA